jgi:SulP family sulfate permease
MFAGVIAGIVGGVVVSVLSGSEVSVSGPAAGLAVIVMTSIQGIGSYQGFLVAVVLSGLLQLVFGLLKFGAIVDYIPNSVIKGMLAGIGVLIVLKQIPHALGRDDDYMGDFRFLEAGGNTTLSDIAAAVASASGGAIIIFATSLALLLAWDTVAKKSRLFQLVPGPLAVVAIGIGLNYLFGKAAPRLQIVSPEHLVNLPVPSSLAEFFRQFTLPDLSAIANQKVWTTAVTIAVAPFSRGCRPSGPLQAHLLIEPRTQGTGYRKHRSRPYRWIADHVSSGPYGGKRRCRRPHPDEFLHSRRAAAGVRNTPSRRAPNDAVGQPGYDPDCRWV